MLEETLTGSGGRSRGQSPKGGGSKPMLSAGDLKRIVEAENAMEQFEHRLEDAAEKARDEGDNHGSNHQVATPPEARRPPATPPKPADDQQRHLEEKDGPPDLPGDAPGMATPTWNLLYNDIKAMNLAKLQRDLEGLERELQEDRYAFDINKCPATSIGRTLLGYAAEIGWLQGVEALVEWDHQRTDKGPRLRIDGRGSDIVISPLTRAADAGHVEVVKYLIEQRAAALVGNSMGRTPLEVAVHRVNLEMVKVLLTTPGSDLAYGMAPVQMKLAEVASDPKFGLGDTETQLVALGRYMSTALQPRGSERDVIGDLPQNHLDLYRCRVMHALATSPHWSTPQGRQVELLLMAHSYDSLLREMSIIVVTLSCVLVLCCLFAQIVFSIRLYGGATTPVSLAHMLPGGFDPIRIAQADFDPSRMPQRFPYKTAPSPDGAESLPLGSLIVSSAFFQSAMGNYCSWSFQLVRIPPEKEPHDEEFLSDDDDSNRAKVCEGCRHRAEYMYTFEIVCRLCLAQLLSYWLIWSSQNWFEGVMICFVYCFHSMVVSAVAFCTTPKSEAASSDQSCNDSAKLVYALFDVQDGPRWTRSICTTRSTAASKMPLSRLTMRRRQRRGPRSRDHSASRSSDKSSDKDEPTSSGPEERPGPQIADTARNLLADDAPEIAGAEGHSSASSRRGRMQERNLLPEGAASYEQWQEAYLKAGMLHTLHGPLIRNSAANLVSAAATVMWLTHMRMLCFTNNLYWYESEPKDVFQTFGTRGSFDRCCAVLLELAVFGLAAERLYHLAGLLEAATGMLDQRQRGMQFAVDHQPAVVPAWSGGAGASSAAVMEAIRRIEECERCFGFAVHLSSLRWAVLQRPLQLVASSVLIMHSIAIFELVLFYFLPASTVDPLDWILDPMVPLCVGLCLMRPLLSALINGALCNRLLYEQRDRLKHEVEAALSKIPAGDETQDVQCAMLRVKASEALLKEDLELCWHTGRALGFQEPLAVVVAALVACGLSIVAGSALPGLPGSPEIPWRWS